MNAALGPGLDSGLGPGPNHGSNSGPTPEPVVLAVDSGGSGTRLLLMDPLGVGGSGVGDERRTTTLPAASWERGGAQQLVELVIEGWRGFGSPRVDTVSIGVAATPLRSSAEQVTAAVGRALGARQVLLANDAVTAHLGALGGAAGVALVVGSGVACVAWDPASALAPRLFDGHGPLLADRGSASWIGRRAVVAVLDACQDCPPQGAGASAVADLVVDRFGPPAEVATRLHLDPNPIAALTGLARDVVGLVGRDRLADQIVAEAAEALAATVARAVAALTTGDPESPGITVALGGGALSPETALQQRLAALVSANPAVAAVGPALSNPLEGAALLATLTRRPDGVFRWAQDAGREDVR